jgi:multidrug efflux pump subunit AcrA (membrane-fusion protein)
MRLDSLPMTSFNGRLQSVSALAQPLERNSPLRYFTCDATIRGAGKYSKRIRPGMTLQAEVILEKYDSCFVVPASAVTAKDTENLVYVQQDKDFIPKHVEIAPGPYGQTVILNGVQEGEIVALHNPYETRQLHLPDFGKATGNMELRRPRMRGIRFR